MTQAVDFLVWQGYPPGWVFGLTLRQLLAVIDAAAKRTATMGGAMAANLLKGRH